VGCGESEGHTVMVWIETTKIESSLYEREIRKGYDISRPRGRGR
jgi:hypothetical protein